VADEDARHGSGDCAPVSSECLLFGQHRMAGPETCDCRLLAGIGPRRREAPGKLPQRLYHGINEDEAGSNKGKDGLPSRPRRHDSSFALPN
jgi:hypothetical protein